jgi:hypothetical protein
MAVLLNVGPLVVPLTRALYYDSHKVLYPQPPKLFSHNDQQSMCGNPTPSWPATRAMWGRTG